MTTQTLRDESRATAAHGRRARAAGFAGAPGRLERAARQDATRTWERWTADFAAAGKADDDFLDFE
jgi:hypothetical protein